MERAKHIDSIPVVIGEDIENSDEGLEKGVEGMQLSLVSVGVEFPVK